MTMSMEMEMNEATEHNNNSENGPELSISLGNNGESTNANSQVDHTLEHTLEHTIDNTVGSDSLMSRIQGLLQMSKTDGDSFNQSITKLDESLSMLDTGKRLEELNSLAAVVDKQFVELFQAINKEPSSSQSAQSPMRSPDKSVSEGKARSDSNATQRSNATRNSNVVSDIAEEQTLPMSMLIENSLNEQVSKMSLTVSDRERELDQVLNRIKSRNQTIAEKSAEYLNQTPRMSPRDTFQNANIEEKNHSKNTTFSNQLSSDSLGKHVNNILDKPLEKLELDDLTTGARILKDILNTARSSNQPSNPGTESEASYAPSTADLQRQITAFETSEMWRYVQKFLPGSQGREAGLAAIASSSSAPSISSYQNKNKSRHQQNSGNSRNSRNFNQNTQKSNFMTSTASPTPQKPTTESLTISPEKNSGSSTHRSDLLPSNHQIKITTLPKVSDITASTIASEHLAMGDSHPNLDFPRRDLFKITTSESEELKQTVKRPQDNNTTTDENTTTFDSSKSSYKIPTLGDFRQMSSSEQREIMEKLRKIRQKRGRTSVAGGSFKRVPSLEKMPISSDNTLTANSVHDHTVGEKSWFKNAVESSKNEEPVPKAQDRGRKRDKLEKQKIEEEKVRQKITHKKVIHEISDSNMDTSAAEVITIVHRSKRTHQEKSVKVMKTRALQTSFVTDKENKKPVENKNSEKSKSVNSKSQTNEVNTSTETIVLADPKPEIEKMVKPKIDPLYAVKPPTKAQPPVVWFDDIAGSMKEWEADKLDARPIQETVNLQERFLLYNRKFISKSRSRLRKIDLMQQERHIQEVWQEQRDALKIDNFELNGELDKIARKQGRNNRDLSPVLMKRREVHQIYGRTRSPSPPRKTNPKTEARLLVLHNGEHRPIKPKDMLKKSRQSWKKLPENKQKLLESQRKAKYATYRLNAKCFNHRVQQEALGARDMCT
jgi:hypothetical protein